MFSLAGFSQVLKQPVWCHDDLGLHFLKFRGWIFVAFYPVGLPIIISLDKGKID